LNSSSVLFDPQHDQPKFSETDTSDQLAFCIPQSHHIDTKQSIFSRFETKPVNEIIVSQAHLCELYKLAQHDTNKQAEIGNMTVSKEQIRHSPTRDG
jgi:hypothetical protein